MNTISAAEKRLIENCIKDDSLSVVDLNKLAETNPALYKKILKHCKENGIDPSQGKIDESVLAQMKNQLTPAEKRAIENVTAEENSGSAQVDVF
jgi:hypothetical protein